MISLPPLNLNSTLESSAKGGVSTFDNSGFVVNFGGPSSSLISTGLNSQSGSTGSSAIVAIVIIAVIVAKVWKPKA